MLPTISLVGRPNVGKSTLFNQLTHSRNAIVADQPGLTRDRQYGTSQVPGLKCIIIDTGGLSEVANDINQLMIKQVETAILESDHVLFLVDAKAGISAADETIAQQLRSFGKPITLVANKTEAINHNMVVTDLYQLGLGEPQFIAAIHGKGIRNLAEHIAGVIPQTEVIEQHQENLNFGVKIALIGRPNVGKSTLINRILGEERVVVCDVPGTTRDSIYIPFEKEDHQYTFIDTAGIRRKSKVETGVEKFSVVKTLQAIDDAHVIILVLDASEAITDQDAKLLGHIIKSGTALFIAINKWDGLETIQKSTIQDQLSSKFPFMSYAKVHKISALHGTGVGHLFSSIHKAYEAANKDLPTPELTRLLELAIQQHQPPLTKGRRIKLKYAHQGGKMPPIIIIHGNQTEHTPNAYTRYLENFFRESLQLFGTPIRIEYKSGDNPFKNQRNKLTPRQMRKKKRLVKFVKRK